MPARHRQHGSRTRAAQRRAQAAARRTADSAGTALAGVARGGERWVWWREVGRGGGGTCGLWLRVGRVDDGVVAQHAEGQDQRGQQREPGRQDEEPGNRGGRGGRRAVRRGSEEGQGKGQMRRGKGQGQGSGSRDKGQGSERGVTGCRRRSCRRALGSSSSSSASHAVATPC